MADAEKLSGQFTESTGNHYAIFFVKMAAQFGVVHGVAIGLMLPSVMRFNAAVVGSLYDDLQHCSSVAAPPVERIAALRGAAALPERLGDYGIPRERLSKLAEDAARRWTGGFNPRPVGERELLEIYEDAF